MIDEPRLRQLLHVFLEENKKLNLSAFREEEHAWVGNILDSLGFLHLSEKEPKLQEITSLLDIGTGGGFPLLPLALTLPAIQCAGIDSTKKKIDAVERMVETLKIPNVKLLSGRMEDLAHQEALEGKFDLVTARAVASLSVLLEYAARFLKVGGHAAFWKSTKVASELAASAEAQKTLRMPFVRTQEYSLPEGWGDRMIVLFKKTGETPKEYPRKTGLPKQKPL